ncbi:MAG: RloB family protein [Gammaproteobacteria bacterium]|nr:RloB family protein [Gammaproteobacteria bacterium]
MAKARLALLTDMTAKRKISHSRKRLSQRDRYWNIRSSRKVYYYSAEGTKTEKQYFDAVEICLGAYLESRLVKKSFCFKYYDTKQNTSVHKVIEKFDKFLQSRELHERDQFEAWVVFDSDQRPPTEITALHNWADGTRCRYVALSVPKFEYWLLLHFENAGGTGSPRHIDRQLRKHIPHYKKGIERERISLTKIQTAVRRAKKRHQLHLDSPNGELRYSTVYKLIESVLQFEGIEIDNAA